VTDYTALNTPTINFTVYYPLNTYDIETIESFSVSCNKSTDYFVIPPELLPHNLSQLIIPTINNIDPASQNIEVIVTKDILPSDNIEENLQLTISKNIEVIKIESIIPTIDIIISTENLTLITSNITTTFSVTTTKNIITTTNIINNNISIFFIVYII
jgi:hypothetical protein